MSESNFYDSFYWLSGHPMFRGRFLYCLDIEVMKVNPETGRVEDDESLNTKVEIWLEIGHYNGGYITHDIDLDCGGDTFEEAIVELAKVVEKKYGDYNVELDFKGDPKGVFKELTSVKSEEELVKVTESLKAEGKQYYCSLTDFDGYREWYVYSE